MPTLPTIKRNAAAQLRCVAIASALSALVPLSHAQVAPAPSSAATSGTAQEPLALTPFEVSTSKDQGYAAGNTLSGGRLDTPLAITPGSISVMTKQFMEDFDLTDINQASAWTLSMEMVGGPETGTFAKFLANFRGAGTNSASYPSRNGALQYSIADSYNSDRFEFQRGPNGALFGEGGPGGLQSSGGKQVRLNNRATSTSLRVDSYGGYRATIDTNFGKDRFGVRLNALNQNIRSYQDGTSNKQNAITVTAAYKISESTQLSAEFERSAEWNTLFRKTYGEQASLWNRTTFNADNTTIANAGTFGLSTYGSTTQDRWVWNFGTNSLINYRGVQYQTVGLGYAIPWHGRPEFANFKPGMGKTFFLGPADAIADRDLNSRAVYLDHRFTPNFFARLAWNTADSDPVTVWSNGTPGDYRIDVNRLLPNGQTNPNFGKAYSESGQSSEHQGNNVDEYRLTLNYNFAAPKWYDMKSRLVFNGGWRQDLYQSWAYGWRRTNNSTVAAPSDTQNGLTYRIYYDQPRPRIAPILTPQVLNVNGTTWEHVRTGTGGTQSDNDRRLTHGQIVSQTSFLDERFGVTFSFRRDRSEDDVTSAIRLDTAAPWEPLMGNNGVVGDHGRRTAYVNSKTGGFVAYPFKTKSRWIAPIGLEYNYSQNFSVPNTGNPLITGENPDAPTATTKDFGLRYAMPNGLAYATLKRYKTEQTGQLGNFGSAGDFRSIYSNLGYTDSEHTGNTAFNYRDTSDRKLEGWEFELTANPSRNVTFTANYSHPIVTTISDSPMRRAYYAAHLAEFQAGAAATAGQVINGRIIVDPLAIQQGIQNIENSFNGFTPGTLANGLARHIINVAGSYRFTEGPMKGLGVNAGVNYRGHRKQGSRDAIIKFGLQRAPTVAENSAAAYDYLWVDPTWAFTAGANYTRRFGKYNTRFQINITNLFDDDKPQWTGYSTINAGQLNNNSTNNVLTVPNGNQRMQVLSGFNQLDPRKISFTTTVSF